jgi:SAM-dependent methyltransferase
METRAEVLGIRAAGQQVMINNYEREDTLSFWLAAYELEKERCFISCIDQLLPEDQRVLLDIGCGTGLHTQLWSERNKRVTASDFSTKFRDHVVATYAFPFILADVLNCTIADSFDIVFCMAIATILGEQPQRFQTYTTLARLVRARGSLIFVGPSSLYPKASNGERLHVFDENDLAKLKELDLEVVKVFRWGITPKIMWRVRVLKSIARAIEAIGCCLGIGAREVIVCRKGYGLAQ